MNLREILPANLTLGYLSMLGRSAASKSIAFRPGGDPETLQKMWKILKYIIWRDVLTITLTAPVDFYPQDGPNRQSPIASV